MEASVTGGDLCPETAEAPERTKQKQKRALSPWGCGSRSALMLGATRLRPILTPANTSSGESTPATYDFTSRPSMSGCRAAAWGSDAVSGGGSGGALAVR